MTQTLRRLLHEEPSLQTCEASIRQHEDELRSTGFVLPPFGECEEEACPDEHRPKFFFDPDWFERVHGKLTVYGVEMLEKGVDQSLITQTLGDEVGSFVEGVGNADPEIWGPVVDQ